MNIHDVGLMALYDAAYLHKTQGIESLIAALQARGVVVYLISGGFR